MITEHFHQSPPRLSNQFDADRVLTSWLRRHLPASLAPTQLPRLRALGELAAGELLSLQQADRLREPSLTRFDAWGRRVDQISLTPLWQRCREIAAREGLVATGYDKQLAQWARPLQFAGVYLFHSSSDVYTCPLAMTDGAARVLLDAGNSDLRARALPHLLSRDPAQFWTSGQWMTEAAGGSDLSGSQTEARRDADGHWRLYGKKWFSSAATSEMALTLARPQGRKALALFYTETGTPGPRHPAIEILRLKDKLGTRKLPTAELLLDGLPAEPVYGLDAGIRHIAPMLNITRCWNAVCALANMRRGVALARDYAQRRMVRGRPLVELPLHARTLAGLQAELEGSFHLVFHQLWLLGQKEAGLLDTGGEALLRLITPLSKLLTGKQAVSVSSEVIECFGGAGYVEDVGVAVLLRDAQVLPIWEGTTNVLALDVLRVLRGHGAEAYLATLRQLLQGAKTAAMKDLVGSAAPQIDALVHRLGQPDHAEADARQLAVGMARALSFALLAEHAAHELEHHRDMRPQAAAAQYLRHGLWPAGGGSDAEADLLARDEVDVAYTRLAGT